MSVDPEQLVGEITRHAEDRKASEIVALDLRGVLGYADYFVICSGGTPRQVRAIQDAIVEGLKHEGDLLPMRTEGTPDGGWVLIDYGDVIVHIFTPQMRDFYRLERLWGEAPARAAG